MKPVLEVASVENVGDHIAARLRDAIRKDVSELELSPSRLGGLAGPNEAVQLIADNWFVVFVTWLGAQYGGEILKKVAGHHWDNRATFLNAIRDQLKRFGFFAQEVSESDFSVLAAVRIPGTARGAAVALPGEGPEIVWRIAMLARHDEALRAEIVANPDRAYELNRDCSIKVTVSNDDGSLTIYWTDGVGHQQKKIGP